MAYTALPDNIRLDDPDIPFLDRSRTAEPIKGKFKELPDNIKLDQQGTSADIPAFQKLPPTLQGVIGAGYESLIRPGIEFGTAGFASAPFFAAGNVPAGLLASGIGYRTGKLATREISKLMGAPEDNSSAPFTGLLGNKLPQTAKDIISGAEYQAEGAVGGEVLSRIAGKVISPLSKEVSTLIGRTKREFPQEIKDKMAFYAQKLYSPSPSEIIPNSKTLSILESVLGYSPLAGDVMLKKNSAKLDQLVQMRDALINKEVEPKSVEMLGKQIKEEAKSIFSAYKQVKGEQLDAMVDKFMTGIGGGLSKYEAGKTFGEIMRDDLERSQETTKQLYDAAKELLPMKGTDTVLISSGTRSTAKNLLDVELSKTPAVQNKKVIAILKDFLPANKDYPQEVIDRSPQLRAFLESQQTKTWQGLDKTRSALLERVRAVYRETGGKPTDETRILSALSDAIDTDMESFARDKGGAIWDAFQKARAASRTMHELYDKDVLKIMNLSPQKILNRIINNGEVDLLNQIEKATGGKGIAPLRQGFFQNLLDSSSKGNELNPNKLRNNTAKISEDVLNKLATPEQKAMIKRIADHGIFINERATRMKTVDFLESIISKDSENIINAIIKPNNIENIKLAQKLLPPELLKEVTSNFLENNIFKTGKTGIYMPVSSAGQFVKYRDTLKQLLSKEQFDAMSEFIKLGQDAKKIEALAVNASQTGQVFVGHSELVKLMKSPTHAFTYITLGIPYLLARMYTSPIALKYLTSAAKLPENSPEAMAFFIKAWESSAPAGETKGTVNIDDDIPQEKSPSRWKSIGGQLPPAKAIGDESQQ